jgi:hypothetical protein
MSPDDSTLELSETDRYGNGNRTPTQQLARSAVIAGALSSLVIGYLFIQGTPFSKQENTSITISAGSYRASPLYVVTSTATTPVVVTADGVQKKALDMVVLADGSTLYSLIEPGDILSSNIYRVDTQGIATQLTNSATAKLNLSVDMSQMRVAYEESQIKNNQDLLSVSSWDVMQLDLTTHTVVRITKGVQPRYIGTGALLVGQKDGVVLYPPEANGNASSIPIVSPKIYTLYAVSSDGTRFASYNTKTAMIDVFDITPNGTLSYRHSSKAEQHIMNMNFSGKDPVSVESTPSPKGMVYTVTRYGDTSNTQWNIVSMNGAVAQRLLYVTK